MDFFNEQLINTVFIRNFFFILVEYFNKYKSAFFLVEQKCDSKSRPGSLIDTFATEFFDDEIRNRNIVFKSGNMHADMRSKFVGFA